MTDFTDLCQSQVKTGGFGWGKRGQFRLVLPCEQLNSVCEGSLNRTDLSNETKVAEIVRKSSMYRASGSDQNCHCKNGIDQ